MTINGKSYSDVRNLNLKGGATGTGLLRWKAPQTGATSLWASNPFSTDDYGLYLNASGSLVFSSLGSTTILGVAGGGGAVPTWEQIFANDKTLTVTGTTFTVNDAGTGANDIFTASSTANGSGSIIQITNGGSGKDINGTSGTWSVTKLGAGAFLSLATATVNGAGSGITIGDSGANVVTIGTNSNTITLAKAATFSSTVTVTDGLVTLISSSNIAASTLITNNTVSTFGASAASAGVLVVRSTSLTTGSLLRLQLTEGTLTTGNYIDCYDVSGSAIVFEVGKYGAITQGGAGGSNIQTITAGDFLMSDGSITMVDADNAATLSITNDTATTNSVFVFAGSGVFTGTTTTSFMTLTPSGLTTGTALYIATAGATTSVGVVDIAVAGLTSGSALRITSTTTVLTTGGKLIELNGAATVAGNLLTATTTGAYTGTGMILVTAGAATTGVLVSVVSTTGLTSGSLIRATSSTAGAVATNGAISFTATGAFTSTASTLGFLHLGVATTVTGTGMSILGGAMTTGIALNITDPSTGMTSGSLLRVITATTGAVATNGIISFQASGVFTSTSNAGFVNITANSTTAGTVLAVNATGLVDGIGIYSPSAEAGLTTGKYMSLGGKFTVAKFGATVIAGSAAGTAALTLTAGDILVSAGSIKSASASASGGVGYATGAGGTATQGTNRSTGVTVSPNPSLCGTITTDTTSLAAGASAEFVVTNSAVAIGDVVVVSQRSGSSTVAGVAGTTVVEVVTVTNGTFTISVNNNSSTTAETGAIIINYLILKAVTS